MKESLFKHVEIGAVVLWLVCLAIYGLRMEGYPVAPMMVVYALGVMLLATPVYAGMVIFRWKTKWPRTVNWFEIALALAAINTFLMSGRSLLYIYDGAPMIFMKVILPTLMIVLAALAAAAGIAWYKDRERQRPAH